MTGLHLIITTINPPTRAVRAFAGLDEVDRTIVVGDKKTPHDWSSPGCDYLPPEFNLDGSLLQPLLPFNHYTRKNLGYLYAMREGATVIAESDDDNIPYDNWSFPARAGTILIAAPRRDGIVNQYSYFTSQSIWPRGLPLDRILDPNSRITADAMSEDDVVVGVWQALADGDPDVDAIYRLTSNLPCKFEDRSPFALLGPAMAPLNSQNTAWFPALYPAMYLPSTVTFRYTDILRGIVASAVAFSQGQAVGFTGATVFQDRNEHDFVRDFESEVPVYLTAEKAFDVALAAAKTQASVSAAVRSAYDALHRSGIIDQAELPMVDAWLSDVALFSSS